MSRKLFQASALSGVPQILPRRTPEPDGAAGHAEDRSAPGFGPRLAGRQAVPTDVKRARTQRSGAAVRFVNSIICDPAMQLLIEVFFTPIPVIMSNSCSVQRS